MNDNEFTIKPKNINNTRRHHRPLPPGQTRHLYEDDERKRFDAPDFDDFDDNEETVVMENEDGDKTFFADENSKSGTKKTSQKKKPASKRPSSKISLSDRRITIWFSLFCILLSGAITVVLLNYIRTGALDQSIILGMSPTQIVDAGVKIKNPAGPVGAWFGNVLFAKGFGLGAFVIAAYFLLLGYRLLFKKPFNFFGMTMRFALLTITVSIVTALLTYGAGARILWGGVHGLYINRWVMDLAGIPGAIFLSVLLVATVATVYYYELRRFYGKYKEFVTRRREERRARQEEIRLKRQVELEKMRAAAGLQTNEDEEDDVSDQLIEDEDTELQFENETETTIVKTNTTTVKITPVPDSDYRDSSGDYITTIHVQDQTNTHNQDEQTSDIAFDIDTPVDEGTNTPAATTSEKDADNEEPGFDIDVPQPELGKNTGSIAEKLVAEKGEIDPRAELSRFKFPTLDMLEDRPVRVTADAEEQEANQERIIKTLGNYGITIESIKATVGPTVTLYEIVPTEGIRIANIKRLEDDIALSLAAKGIRIIAPMPGKGTVGIEVPNREPQIVSMRTILASKKFRESKGRLPIALGATISNEIFVTDLAAMPHALVAGATGQGKSVGLNVLITSLLYRMHPTELKFVLIDPKMVEFSVYERLRGHYLASLPGEEDAIVTNPAKVLTVLNSLCTEMDNRYAMLRNASVNKIEDYNRKYCQRRLSAEKGHKYLPYIVVIIDEFADLIMTGGKEIEMPVMRITQKARAVGIHMIIATQRPSTNVLTGLIKANCPSRIAFRVLQNVDSRTILDRPGAEHLIGRGDMLYSQGGELERMQCAFITSDEVETICNSIDNQPGFEEPYPLPEPVADTSSSFGSGGGSIANGGLDRDPLFDEAARFVVLSSTASTSSLQRRFEIGYNRAGKIMDQMEACGIVGPSSGSKPRAVLVDATALELILANR